MLYRFFLYNRLISLKEYDSIVFSAGTPRKKIIPPPKTKFRLKSITIDTQKDHHFTLSWRLVNNIILGKTFFFFHTQQPIHSIHISPHCLQTFYLNLSKRIKGVSRLVEPRDSISMSAASHATWQTHKFFVCFHLFG